METIITCPECDSENVELLDEVDETWQCQDCDMLFGPPMDDTLF